MQEPKAAALRWFILFRARFRLRLFLLIAVILLFIDAFFYSGAYTQAVYAEVAMAAERFVAFIGDAVDYGPDSEGAVQTISI